MPTGQSEKKIDMHKHTHTENQNLVNPFYCLAELFPFPFLFPEGLAQKTTTSKDTAVS